MGCKYGEWPLTRRAIRDLRGLLGVAPKWNWTGDTLVVLPPQAQPNSMCSVNEHELI
jgi:hypothetical protein